MKRDKILILGSLVLAAVLFGGGWYWVRKSEAEKLDRQLKADTHTLIRDYSPRLGPEDAKVTVVEFLDPECEACRALYPLMEKLRDQFPGKIQLILRFMPLHRNSAHAIAVLEAARRQGKFPEALKTMFDHQPEWADHEKPKPELLMGYMRSVGLDMERLQASLQDSEIQSRILQDREDGRALGVHGTPSLFINGQRLTSITYESIQSAIQAALATP